MQDYRDRKKRPLKLGIINTGGTLLCLPNPRGELEPVRRREELLEIVVRGADFGAYTDLGLLELNVIYHDPKDSSQFLDKHREPWREALAPEYINYDAFLVIHGTDTGAESARFFHLTFPYYDPITFWREGKIVFNWTKPLVLVSSQEPAATRRKGELVPNAGSDGDVNLVLSLGLLSSGDVGEVGILTNLYHALRGPASKKGSEAHVPAYTCDVGVPPIAERTAFGIVYNDMYYLHTVSEEEINEKPTVIMNSADYEARVLLASELAHFSMCEAYLEASKDGNDIAARFIKERLPQVILYVSRGAGNVQKDEDGILKEMEKEGIYIVKVPLPGGRVPEKMSYAVPGADIMGVNIEGVTARYKAQAVLALMDQIKIEPERQREFFYEMMRFRFGNEFLPMN